MRQCEPRGDVDVRGVDPDGGQVVESDGGFARQGRGLEDDSVVGMLAVPWGRLVVRLAAATRAIVTSYSAPKVDRVR